ncbi:MAG TPA: molecular chaperone TorD, partial [Chromatiales bacterium]|nr:molecular chaperone TorD [Chromatiales bacterium]
MVTKTSAPRLRSLALLLAYPGEESNEGLQALGEREPWLSPALNELRHTPLDVWQAEHTRLFLNGYPKTVAPPFESAYRYGQMDGNAAIELERLYRRAGLGTQGAPADYLGTQLEFAAWLVENGDPELLLPLLWHEHLAAWLPRFCSDL